VSFQQIQKYESGFNRISCSTLYSISQELDVPLLAFFERLDTSKRQFTANFNTNFNKADLEFIRCFVKLPSETKLTFKSLAKRLSA
jgi:transcriptional regulator with XRE-family HTH domain